MIRCVHQNDPIVIRSSTPVRLFIKLHHRAPNRQRRHKNGIKTDEEQVCEVAGLLGLLAARDEHADDKLAAGADAEVDHADVHVLVDVLAALLRLILGISEDHQERDEDERMDEELDDGVLEDPLAICSLQGLVLALQT